MELRVLEYIKQKDGTWKVIDETGNEACGVTKEGAESQYECIYVNNTIKSHPQVDTYLKNIVMRKNEWMTGLEK